MDEVVRDLVVLAGIAALCFIGATEYVYWRFGFDKLVDSLHRIETNSMWTRVHTGDIRTALAGRKVA